MLDSGSSLETESLGNDVKIYLEGMIVLNTTAGTVTNISTVANTTEPRTRGALQYIPGIGARGILVLVGGTSKPSTELDSALSYINMTEIDVFDVASLYTSSNSTGWYKQQATGNIPAPRGLFCMVLASAPDNSSHNLYIYGGINEATRTYYDDVYVLSIPSFTWTMVYGEGNGPKYGHTCHLVGNRQMLTVGGIADQEYQRKYSWGQAALALQG